MSEGEPSFPTTDPEEALGLEEMNSYLSESANAYQRYRVDSLSLLVNLRKFSEETKGSALGEYARQLEQEMGESIHVYLLKLFQAIDLKNNPEVLKCVLGQKRKKQMPQLRLDSKEEAEHHYVDYAARYDYNSNTIYFRGATPDSYEIFRSTFLHELTHGWISGIGWRPWTAQLSHWILEEGITEFLASQVTGLYGRVYRWQQNLAAALYDLDKDMLMDWYCMRDDDGFRARLAQNLKKYHPATEAETMAQQVVSIVEEVDMIGYRAYSKERRALKGKVADEDEIEDLARQAGNRAAGDFVEQLITKIHQR